MRPDELTGTITIVQTQPERRQIARVLPFTADLAPYINWDQIAQQAREMGADFETRGGMTDSVIVTIFWRYAEQE